MPYKLTEKEAAALAAVVTANEAIHQAIYLCQIADLTGDAILGTLDNATLDLDDVARTIRGEG